MSLQHHDSTNEIRSFRSGASSTSGTLRAPIGAPDGSASTAAPADPSWRELAECRGHTVLFFPKKAERPQARARREAKAQRLCDNCAVQEPCQQFAREHREYGFWAGESEEERHLAGFTVAAPIGIRARDARSVSRTDELEQRPA